VKGPGDGFSDAERTKFEVLSAVTGAEVFVLEFRKSRGSGRPDRELGRTQIGVLERVRQELGAEKHFGAAKPVA